MQKKYTLLSFVIFLVTTFYTTAQTYNWQNIDIGSTSSAGSNTYAGGILNVSGAGNGMSQSGDNLHYTYITNAGGDVDVIAKVTGINVNTKASFGIMLRNNNAANATTAAVVFTNNYTTIGKRKHAVGCTVRDATTTNPDNKYSANGIVTELAFPFWMRITRMGKNVAVSKSKDGKIWTAAGNLSGGYFNSTGAIELGFFVAGGSSLATATFDSIYVGPIKLGYTTSWIGNNFSGNVDKGHVSNAVNALWVGADGTCYTNAYYDEAAEAGKIYKDGAIVKSLNEGDGPFSYKNGFFFGNNLCGEGSITGSATKILAVGNGGKRLMTCDRLASTNSLQPVIFADNLWDASKNISAVSGMAIVGNKFYVADSRSNKIRVAQDGVPIYTDNNTSSFLSTTNTIDVTGVTNAAPAEVYKTMRSNDDLPYSIPNLTAGIAYKLRCHFALYEAGNWQVTINSNPSSSSVINLTNLTGGLFKAAVVDVDNVQVQNGRLFFAVSRSLPGNGRMVLCAFEILNPNGTQAFAVNCGGPAVGNFQAESNELSNLAFNFTRPGPMVADNRGDLWIIQEANDFPIGTKVTAQYPCVIKCYQTNGTFTGKQITDVTNATAIAYDAVNDKLLIADNGSNQNIRLYDNLATTPTYNTSFGVQGGIYAGANPGLLADAASGGAARFYLISGVGVDAQGNVYVSCENGTDLRKYTTTGNLVWRLNGIPFTNTPDVDSDTDGNDLYAPFWHATMDYNQTIPGAEWNYVGYNSNPFLYNLPDDKPQSQTIIRRLTANRNKILFTSSQGTADHISIYRYNGEIAIPCGRIDGGNSGQPKIWTDNNGDGYQTTNEVVGNANAGGIQFYQVDKNGDIWQIIEMGLFAGLRHFPFQGLNAFGVPIYNTYSDEMFPAVNGNLYEARFHVKRAHYDFDADKMYLMGAANQTVGDPPTPGPVSYLARFDNWKLGNRTAKWAFPVLNNDSTDLNFTYEERPFNEFRWMGFDVVGSKIFLAELYGGVRIYDTATGKLEKILSPGPEVAGSFAWEDAAMGLRAYKRSNGEYVVFTENSGYNAKCNLFRIPPPTPIVLAVKDITLSGKYNTNNVPILQYKVQANGDVAKLEIYISKDGNNFTLLHTNTAVDNTVQEKIYNYTDSSNINGAKLFYKIRGVDVTGNSVYSNTILLTKKGIAKVYPNPAVNWFNLDVTQLLVGASARLILFASNGEVVMKKEINSLAFSQKINIENLASGVYNLQMITATVVENFTITVVK
jgi:Secretion system C-terminal sorting domain